MVWAVGLKALRIAPGSGIEPVPPALKDDSPIGPPEMVSVWFFQRLYIYWYSHFVHVLFTYLLLFNCLCFLWVH